MIAIWQIVVLTGWKPQHVLPPPIEVGQRLVENLTDSSLLSAIGTTMRRIGVGFGLALMIGTLLGIAIVRWSVLRTAIASLITGLQTMPSIAWFPLAILLFGLTEQAILFVVVLGAAPSVANGLITGVDHVPRILLRAGKVLGARGVNAYRLVILPASLPSFIGGMKQAWAFAWRSLMAGELLVIIAQQPALGVRLQLSRELSDARGLLATMIVILVIGILVDCAALRPAGRRGPTAMGPGRGEGVGTSRCAARPEPRTRPRLTQASGAPVSSSMRLGRCPSTRSWTDVASSSSRRAARTATHTSRRCSAGPRYSTSSGREPRTLAMGPSTARITSARLMSAGRRARRNPPDVPRWLCTMPACFSSSRMFSR